MSYSSKVVFPPPPPTVNALSSEQRSQLLRKTKKLSQLLGSSPRLLDDNVPNVLGPVRIEFPYKDSRFSRSSSVDSFSSSSSGSDDLCFEILTPLSTDSHSKPLSRSSTSSSRLSKRSSRDSSDSQSAPTPPLLRLAVPPSLETIPASPLPYDQYSPYSSSSSSPSRSHSRASSIDSFEDGQRYTICPSPMPHQRDSIVDPSFTIPSTNSLRLKKMERLRKKLGDGVPVDLVFPETPTNAMESPASRDDEKWKTESSREIVLPSTATTPRTGRSSNRISNSRDSLVGPSPHHARRHGESIHSLSAKPEGKKIPLPIPTTPNPPKQPLRPSNQRLWAIIESPEEHGDAATRRSGNSRRPSLVAEY